jgi:Tol biopolymer transport system component
MDLWRIAAAGGELERLTQFNSQVGYPTPIDANTVLIVMPDKDGSGPWLFALDVNRKLARRVSKGLDRYTSVSASADGHRLVVTAVNPQPSLWSVPILDRPAGEREAKPYPLPTPRALAPRFGGSSDLFYLSSRGGGYGLSRFQNGQAAEIWKESDGALLEPPAVSADGRRVAIVLRKSGKPRLYTLAPDGTDLRALTDTVEILGTPAWSPDAPMPAAKDCSRFPRKAALPPA